MPLTLTLRKLVQDITPLDIVLNKELYDVFDSVVAGQYWVVPTNAYDAGHDMTEDELAEALLDEVGLVNSIQLWSEMSQGGEHNDF